MDPSVRTLGLNIRKLRKERGYTQEELTERAEIDVRTLQRVEAGEADTGFVLLDKVCQALHCDWNTLTAGITDTLHLFVLPMRTPVLQTLHKSLTIPAPGSGW